MDTSSIYLAETGAGMVAFTALARGLLTGKYLHGVPAQSRAARDGSLSRSMLTEDRRSVIRRLNEIAAGRGQSLAQLAVSWVLRDPRVTSVVVGAGSVTQLEDTIAAVERTEFDAAEVAHIDEVAHDDPAINLWRSQSRLGA
jgi:L-glyceraldehyde 3-phosphate reductase